MRSLILATILVSALSIIAVPANSSPAGFQQVPDPATRTNPTRIQVIDFFWYGCPYCNLFEPQLEDWLDSKPDNVDFIRIPAVIRSGWSNHARAFYTAEALGLLDTLHSQLFAAIHEEDQDLNDMDELSRVFADQGIERARFEEAFNSAAVNRKVQEASILTRRYGIDSVPAIVVNGQYRTNPVLAGGASRVLDAVNDLIASEQNQTKSP